MTSVKLFSKLLRENRKQKIWLRLFSDMLFLVFTLTFFMSEVFLYNDNMLFGIKNYRMVGMTIFLAVLSAFQGYMYLLKSNMTDFYFSIPVLRKQLFLANYINGILVYVIPMFISQSVCRFMVITVGGVRDHDLTGYYLWGLCINLLAYLLFYHLTILAVHLSGNIFAAVGLLGLFLWYVQSVLDEIVTPLCSMFFRTFYKSDLIEKLRHYFVPMGLYEQLNNGEGGLEILPYFYEPDIWGILFIILGNVLLFFLCFFLHKKRDAEAAGMALAFRTAEWILHFVIDIPAAMLTGRVVMTFLDSSYMIAGGIFGSIIGGSVCYGMVEILLRMKFQEVYKSIFLKKRQLIGELILSVVLLGIFLSGSSFYDFYLPDDTKMESVGISINGLDMKKNVDLTEKRLKNVQITGKDMHKVHEWLANEIVSCQDKQKQRLTEVTAAYHLKSGKTIYRTYPIYAVKQIEAFQSIYTTRQYKEGIYEAFSYSNYEGIEISWTNEIENRTLDLNVKETEIFLDTYFEEFTELSIETVEKEFPIGTLKLTDEEFYKDTEVYIYPSFEKTIALLENYGVPVKKKIAEYDISKVEVISYGKAHKLVKKRAVYTTKEEIKNIVGNLVCQNYAMQPVLNPVDTLTEVEVKFENTSRGTVYNVEYYIVP